MDNRHVYDADQVSPQPLIFLLAGEPIGVFVRNTDQ